jgi:uncharacterized membrane protein
MTLEPLRAAPLIIQVHAFAALLAFVLGVFQLAAPKSAMPHHVIGWLWVALMATVVLTSVAIHEIRTWGPWSAIHLLSIFAAVMLPVGVLHASAPGEATSRDHDCSVHRRPHCRRRLHTLPWSNHARRRFRAVTMKLRSLVFAGSAALMLAACATDGERGADHGFASNRISVVTRGSGPDVILIPGLISHRDVWAGVADQLDDRSRLHLSLA